MKTKRPMKVVLFKNRKGEFQLRFVASNGRKLMVTEGYKRWRTAARAYQIVRSGILDIAVKFVNEAE